MPQARLRLDVIVEWIGIRMCLIKLMTVELNPTLETPCQRGNFFDMLSRV